MWLSMLSISDPEMRFWVHVTMDEEQVQGLAGSPE
jgi:hypothetical protein